MPTADVACKNGVTVICFEPQQDRIRESSREQLDEVLGLAESVDPPLLVIDLKDVHYVNSSFVAFLLELSHKISQRKGRFAVCRSMAFCEKVIHSLKLNEVFDLFETPDEAVRAYSKACLT